MLEINFHPFPVLETERLILRRIVAGDAPQILKLRSDPGTMKYIPRPLAKTLEDAMEHFRQIEEKIEANVGINWAISLKNSPEFIGIIGHFRIKPEHYRAEIGYMLLPEFHGKGIMPEAISMVIAYGFEDMKLHSIEAIIDPENKASAAVLEKNGFVREAHLKENEFYDGKFLDTVIYSLLNKKPRHEN